MWRANRVMDKGAREISAPAYTYSLAQLPLIFGSSSTLELRRTVATGVLESFALRGSAAYNLKMLLFYLAALALLVMRKFPHPSPHPHP